MNNLNVAIVQEGPEFFDVKKSVEKAESIIENSGKQGVNLIVFGESWLSGYPFWLDVCPELAYWDNQATKDAFYKMYENSVDIANGGLKEIQKLSAQYGIYICIGVNEKVSSGKGQGTIYNSFVTIGKNGEILNHHRKLVPTFTEKLLYGTGDAHGLKSVETEFGRLGGLICWEHWIPTARQIMHNHGETIHVALWPTVHDKHQLASRHYAFEGRCFVIAAGQILKAKDIPAGLIVPENLKKEPEKKMLYGGSCIIGPDSNFILEPQFDKEETIIFEIKDLDRVQKERMTLDVSGHYNRWDIFDLKYNDARL